MDSPLEGCSILFDARWLGIGGPGRVTRHMLEGLRDLKPAGTWLIWGDDNVTPLLWDGAQLARSRYHPHSLFGQREFFRVSALRCDIAFYPHQMRPLRKICTVEVNTIHDTIPFRYPPQELLQPLMRLYLRRVAALSDLIATDSEFSRRSIEHDLGVDNSRMRVLPLSIDHDIAGRIRARRAATEQSNTALYVGTDLPHKNLDRLITAFAATTFQQRGGQLIMVGMNERSCKRLEAVAATAGAHIEVRGRVSDEELEDLMVRANLVVQPSLEEGFGLPVAEAMAAGIPVASSSGGALPELTRGAVEHFTPTDLLAIARAIDNASNRTGQEDRAWPSPLDLARVVVEICEDARRLHTASLNTR
jgi:glycosyltransferase involved in cell wall biosynthesis